jgi:hypothetical protein
MRFDLIGERDRFIPGWYGQPDRAQLRAEQTRPEWHWPARLEAGLAKIIHMLLTSFLVWFRLHRRPAVTLSEPAPTAEGSPAAL